MGNNKPYRPKAVTIERRLIDQRSKIFKALLAAERDLDVSESLVLLQELIDSYMDLIRLKIAYQVKEKNSD